MDTGPGGQKAIVFSSGSCPRTDLKVAFRWETKLVVAGRVRQVVVEYKLLLPEFFQDKF